MKAVLDKREGSSVEVFLGRPQLDRLAVLVAHFDRDSAAQSEAGPSRRQVLELAVANGLNDMWARAVRDGDAETWLLRFLRERGLWDEYHGWLRAHR